MLRAFRSSARALAPYALGALTVAVLGTGIADAATGGSLVLGRQNTAGATTSLTNSRGTALSLTSKAGTPPLAVSSPTKVTRLNSDLLDGLDSTALQRRVAGTCPGGAVRSVAAGGAVTCADVPVKAAFDPAADVLADPAATGTPSTV